MLMFTDISKIELHLINIRAVLKTRVLLSICINVVHSLYYSSFNPFFMAKILTGGGVSAIRGSIGGSVFSVNANGSYVRNRGNVANRNTESQQLVRARLSAVAMAWRNLTEAQRQQWVTLALEYTYTDNLGISSKLTGFQLFQKFNQSLNQAGLATLSNAPILQTLQAIEVVTASFDISSAILGISLLFLPNEDRIVPENCSLIVEATASLSSGVWRPKRPQFRQIAVLPESTDMATAFAIPNYLTIFGSYPAVGDNYFVRLSLVSELSGERTTPIFVKGTVTP